MKRTLPIVASTITALALAIGGAGCTSTANAATTCKTATASYETALTDYENAAKDATATLDQAKATEGFSLDGNEDATLLTTTLDITKTDSVPECASDKDASDIDLKASALTTAAKTLEKSTTSLNSALDAHLLQGATTRHNDAKTTLTTALDQANALYGSSDGNVADNATRDQLKTAIDDANAALTAKVNETDAAALDQHTKTLQDQLGTLNERKSAVEASQQAKTDADNAKPAPVHAPAAKPKSNEPAPKAAPKKETRKSEAPAKHDKPAPKKSTTKPSEPKKPAPKKKRSSGGGDSKPKPTYKEPKFYDNYDDRGAPPGCHKDSFGNIFGRDCKGDEVWN